MPIAPPIIEAWRLIAKMIYRVGIAIEDSSPAVKRMVARRIIDLQCDLHNFVQVGGGIRGFKTILSNLEVALVSFADDRRDDVGEDPGPYSIEGIALGVLVHLVRLEDCARKWGWMPEELRALGLDIRRDEEIVWATPDHVQIRNSSGRVRYRYRVH